MPELPDLTVYLEALERHAGGAVLEAVELASASLLRTVEPPLAAAVGRRVVDLRRIGKRIAIGLRSAEPGSAATSDGDLYLVIHLMIAGRLRWKPASAKPARGRGAKAVHARFRFGPSSAGVAGGTLVLTEASTRKRASLHVVAGREALASHDPGGLEPLAIDLPAFAQRLLGQSHTLKRALTDPHLFAGIGNAYSDEILHEARLSPVALTTSLGEDEVARLFEAVRSTLTAWTERLRAQTGDAFPDEVTAFRPEMAAHGRFGEPCPRCGAPIQRIVYASNETNYCAACQTGGRLLADRALSRLLKRDWPRSLEELERRRADHAAAPPSERRRRDDA